MIDTSPQAIFQGYCPAQVRVALKKLVRCQQPLFLAGGAVRDILMGKIPADWDFTLPKAALSIARLFADLIGGTFVLLDEKEEVARVVWKDFVFDFSSFRDETRTIEDDLRFRDFTINAMALPFRFSTGELANLPELIDPLGGRDDIQNGLVSYTSKNIFKKDPLRLLRAYRFAACHQFAITEKTSQGIKENVHLITSVSPERVSYELDFIIASSFAFDSFAAMAESSLLFCLYPELQDGVGMNQRGSHHLDVFQHNLAALGCMEKILKNPIVYFKKHAAEVENYLAKSERRKWLKWAALFHDIAKSTTLKLRGDKITFYDHDNCGADLFALIAARFKWSRQDQKQVTKLIRLHMWPFHLNNSLKKTGITARACLKLYKAAAGDMIGLFVLAMADSLAASGPRKPADMEDELLLLFAKIIAFVEEKIKPVHSQPPVLTGRDLIDELGLTPGPIFAVLLGKLEEVQVVNGEMNRQEALAWLRKMATIT